MTSATICEFWKQTITDKTAESVFFFGVCMCVFLFFLFRVGRIVTFITIREIGENKGTI